MELFFLGTGAGVPSPERNVSAMALTLNEERGTMWLFDCGEGTQHQILRSPLKLSRLEFIFITHLHGDHIFGLPGLLTSRANQGGISPVTVFGPPGLESFIHHALQLSGSRVEYELNIREVRDGLLYEDDAFIVESGLLEHRIDSYGYRVIERDQPGTLLKDKLIADGIPPGPIYKHIKISGSAVEYEGRMLDPTQYVGPDRPGRKLAIMGDTRPTQRAMQLAEGVDVLVHEATFAADKADLAHQYFHSTAQQAAETANKADVGTLIMTHFSSRYQGEEVQQLVKEAKAIHQDVYAAYDGYRYVVPRK